MKPFWRVYVPLAVLFAATFIIHDWAYSRFSSDSVPFEQQDEIAGEMVVAIDQAIEAGRQGPASSEPLSSFELTAILAELEGPWRDRFAHNTTLVLTPEESALSPGDLQIIREQGYIIFEDPDSGLWGINVMPVGSNWVIELIFESQSEGGYYFWLIGYWLFYLVALAVVLYLVLNSVLGTSQRDLKQVSESVARIKHTFDQTQAAPVDKEADARVMFQQLNDIEQHIIREKQNHHQHYDDLRDLLHGVAHEFRSPMARASFALDMAENECEAEPVDRASVRSLFQEMESSLKELDGLVKEVLSYSRLEHGRGELDYERTTIQSVVQEIMAKQQPLYQHIVFKAACDPAAYQTLAVNVDSRLFYRVLINLIRNAARFAEHTVEVSWTLSGAQFELRVEDDGPGVPPGKRTRIFEPFTRLDPSRSRDSGGAGLGLAIVKSISSLHGGTIDVTDSALGGACFVLRWPAN